MERVGTDGVYLFFVRLESRLLIYVLVIFIPAAVLALT